MAKGNIYKRRRDKMIAEDPHCHWCGIEVIYFTLELGQKTPYNFATIDHLYTMLEPEKRFEAAKNKDPKRFVLACYRCNQKRNEERVKLYPKEAWKIRQKLGQERKKLLSTQPRPQIFRNLENIENL